MNEQYRTNIRKEKWANEDLIDQSHDAETFTIPSDIKPGLYILRTELLALHGNNINSQPVMGGGPQYYTHCYNVEISGNGNAEPEGVKFPGAYKRNDPGVAFALRNKAKWDNYVSPRAST
jgi:lytic cellulose monooxygenase (C1-hydroxylating)